MNLIEYRPGRYAWVDPATGAVIRPATPEEADQEIARLLTRQAPEPLDLGAGDLGQPASWPPGGRGPNPQDLDAGDLATGDLPDPTLGRPGGEIPDLDGPKPQDLGTGDGDPALGPWPMLDELQPGPNAGTVATDQAGAGFFWWQLGAGPLAGSLAEAVSRYKARRGQRPGTVRACPALAGNGLKAAAEALGLRVVADRYVLAGSVYLEKERLADPAELVG